MSEQLRTIHCGLVPYQAAREAQGHLAAARIAAVVDDLLLLLEHPPVYTRGRRSTPGELPMGKDWYRAQGIEVCDTDRGGRVTYHGPGQLVAYPIVSLRDRDRAGAVANGAHGDVVAYVRRLERVMIETLEAVGIGAQTIEGLTGVWTEGERPGAGATPAAEAHKIGSIGVHVSRGVTTHGLAINVNNDLQPFEWIVPCGIEGARMTSVARELGVEQDLTGFAGLLARRFASLHERAALPMAVAELAQRVQGIEALVAAPPVNPVAPPVSAEAALP